MKKGFALSAAVAGLMFGAASVASGCSSSQDKNGCCCGSNGCESGKTGCNAKTSCKSGANKCNSKGSCNSGG